MDSKTNKADADSAISLLTRWAEPVPEIGPAVYRLSRAPDEHKHAYHVYCPWSLDDRLLLLARYTRERPEAEICVMDAATGTTRVIGDTCRWECHNAARQQWLGNSGRIIFPLQTAAEREIEGGGSEGAENCGTRFAICNPDGSNCEELRTEAGITAFFCCPDGSAMVGGTPLEELFPDDRIAPRHDKGLIRIDTKTGKQQLILSIEQCLDLIPQAEEAAKCHLYMKMFIIHPRSNRILFNLTNTYWELDGAEPVVRRIMSVGLDGSDPRYIGTIAHHPNWHPAENRVVANAKDCNDILRFVLYPGNGDGFADYIPSTMGAGHPTFSPDGRWICTDAAGPDTTQVIFCDPTSGKTTVAMDCHEKGGAYRGFTAVRKRPAGESVMTTLERSARGGQTWQTQRHPAWSRDGSAVLVNSDRGDGSQLYVIDVMKTLESSRTLSACHAT